MGVYRVKGWSGESEGVVEARVREVKGWWGLRDGGGRGQGVVGVKGMG